MNKPVFVVSPKRVRDNEYPTLDLNAVPPSFRRFCVFVASLNKNGGMSIGAGTLAKIRGGVGIITALHLFSKNSAGILVCFFLENNWCAIELPMSNIIAHSNKLDLAVIKLDYVSSWFQPVDLGPSRGILTTEFYAFGCPQGIFGKVWKAELIAINNNDIYTRGFGAPGVSGGGLFTQYGDTFYLWAIHSSLHVSSQTLVSKMVPML